jgi:nitric oxide reductase NorE protein
MTSKTATRLHGDTAMWIFIAMELLTFLLFFTVYMWSWKSNPTMFSEGASTLYILPGLINTILLISGGWMVARACLLAENQDSASTKWLYGASLLGFIFVIVKFGEYTLEMGKGFNMSTNTFYFYYFFLTFVHLAHVLLGILLLVYAASGVKTETPVDYRNRVESSAAYWHMVDIVWIALYPLIYLLPRGSA